MRKNPLILAVVLALGAAGCFSYIKAKTIVARKLGGSCVSIQGRPDPKCSPGEVDPSLTKEILCSEDFHTGSVRNKTTTETQKNSLYAVYGIPHPKNNVGQTQVCELDHIISLQLGGADTLKNIFPQCGLASVSLNQRYFKQKDLIENKCHAMVCAGSIALAEAQKEISTDWRTACK